MRRRVQRTIELLEEKGEFGVCACGGVIRFYSDAGVKCTSCGRLHGVWSVRRTSGSKEEPAKTAQ